MILYYFLEFARITVGKLPPPVSYPIAGAIGDTVYYLWARGRRNMVKSIAAVLAQGINSSEVRINARQGMRNYCKSIVDMLRYAYPQKGVFERDINLAGTENVDNALARGKGAIIAGLHMGNLDLGIRSLAYAGYPIHAIVQNLGSGQIDRFVQKPRVYSGLKLISAANGILQMLDILKRNEIVALMVDSPHHEKGISVKLGQKMISVPSGMAAMALRTGAGIIPCGLIRYSNTKFFGIIGKPVQCKATGNLVEDARELTQSTIAALEGMARIFPDQWYIFHPLIKDSIEDSECIPVFNSKVLL
jgi:lauroyl/myristoyl acyltransferase